MEFSSRGMAAVVPAISEVSMSRARSSCRSSSCSGGEAGSNLMAKLVEWSVEWVVVSSGDPPQR